MSKKLKEHRKEQDYTEYNNKIKQMHREMGLEENVPRPPFQNVEPWKEPQPKPPKKVKPPKKKIKRWIDMTEEERIEYDRNFYAQNPELLKRRRAEKINKSLKIPRILETILSILAVLFMFFVICGIGYALHITGILEIIGMFLYMPFAIFFGGHLNDPSVFDMLASIVLFGWIIAAIPMMFKR